MTAPLLSVRDLHVRAGGRLLLRGVTMQVDAGELVGVIGPNGAGKTTLLRAITGLAPRERGSVDLDGVAIEARGSRERAQSIAVVEQLPDAPPTMLVAELVMLGRFPHLGLLRRESARDAEIVHRAMSRAGCGGLAGRMIGTLSGGERRRAFIARALAQEPRLLLLDEPTAALDARAQAEIFEVARALAEGGAGVLVVIHDLTLAAAWCDRLVLLHEGAVIASGEPGAVITAEHLGAVYGPHVSVLAHPATGLPLVVPAASAEVRLPQARRA
ncbi:MAG: ABC transporter ATP-binding protein [Dehalococcoidia bacterium]